MSSSSSPQNSPRNWLELPREVTASIMSRLVAVDILTNIQFVCKSWFEISKDPLIWRRIDMYKIGDLDLDMDLVGMCCHAVDRSSGLLADINIENFGNDDLLEYIAKRSKGLKRLGLACCYRVSEERMIDVISKLPLLEEIDLTLCMFSVEILEAVGRSCPCLRSLKLNSNAYSIPIDFDPDEDVVHDAEAVSIGKNMPGLRRLQVFGNSMTNMGLKAILDGCPRLESLDLRRCLNLNLDESLLKRCKDRVKELRLPFDPTDDYAFAAGHGDDSDVGSFDDCHHWFSGGEEDYLELVDGDDNDDSNYNYSDVSGDGEPLDYDDLV